MINSKFFAFPFFRFNKAYISEFVYGGIDGVITTFAVVAGAAGAKLDMNIVLVLGFANLIADGFSMSVGNYFSTKAAHDNYDKHRRLKQEEIINEPALQLELIKQIYQKKGLQGDLLNQVAIALSADKEIMVETMMKEELEMIKDEKTAFKTAGVTFISFFFVGLIPLLAYVLALFMELKESSLFIISCLSTGLGLMMVGMLKSLVTEKSRLTGIFETVVLGGAAASLAYIVGAVLENLLLK